jgi:hypothetical protein
MHYAQYRKLWITLLSYIIYLYYNTFYVDRDKIKLYGDIYPRIFYRK